MNTLADFKRAIIRGRTIRVTYLRDGEPAHPVASKPASTLRTVTHTGATKFETRFDGYEAWMDYGAAAEWTFDGDVATWTDPDDPGFQISYDLNPKESA